MLKKTLTQSKVICNILFFFFLVGVLLQKTSVKSLLLVKIQIIE